MSFKVCVTRSACLERLNEFYPLIKITNNWDNPKLLVTVIPALWSWR